jgi:hypothetical protein
MAATRLVDVDIEDPNAVTDAIHVLLKQQEGLIKGIRKTVPTNVVVLIQKSNAIAQEIARKLAHDLRDIGLAILQGDGEGFLVTSVPRELVVRMFDVLGTPMEERLAFGIVPKPVVIFGWGRTAICGEAVGEA